MKRMPQPKKSRGEQRRSLELLPTEVPGKAGSSVE
uniref:Uncharacterized protein n=1 Tax=Anguilla anguilla TaxID=7936 RepID=A0A0E9PPF2_ANGAN